MKILFVLIFFSSFNLYANVLKIIYEKGTVTVTRSGKVIKTKEVFPADKVTTGADSLAILKGDRETLKVQSDSEIVYQPSSTSAESSILLNLGGLVSQINKKKFHVKVGKVAMGVRGTQFFASVDEKEKVWMCVNEGEVEVNDTHKATLVPAGQGVFIKDGHTGKPKAFAWTKQISWEMDESKVKDEKKIIIESSYEEPLDFTYD